MKQTSCVHSLNHILWSPAFSGSASPPLPSVCASSVWCLPFPPLVDGFNVDVSEKRVELDSFSEDFRRASKLGSGGLWMGSLFTSPRQTHPGFISQRWEALLGDVGHTGLRQDAAQKTCLGGGALRDCILLLLSPVVREVPRVPERRGKTCPFLGDTVRSIREAVGYCGVLWS